MIDHDAAEFLELLPDFGEPAPQAGPMFTYSTPEMPWFRRTLMRRLGGVTGDCLGFGVYIGQILILLAACATLP